MGRDELPHIAICVEDACPQERAELVFKDGSWFVMLAGRRVTITG